MCKIKIIGELLPDADVPLLTRTLGPFCLEVLVECGKVVAFVSPDMVHEVLGLLVTSRMVKDPRSVDE